MTTIDDEITAVIKQEGGLVDDPKDPGGKTFEGISERSNPAAWAQGQPSEAQVREIYKQKYVINTGIINIKDPKLQAQVLDFTVNSGPGPAITRLQTILGVPADGVLGPGTLTALDKTDSKIVNNKLVITRIEMIGKIVEHSPSLVKFLGGWLTRCCDFFIA